MDVPIHISFRDVPPSEAVEAAIGQEVADLQNYFPGIISCRAVVSEPHRHQHKGRLYAVQVYLAVPGEELVVSHEHRRHPGHQDVYFAVRDAFHAARRKLEDYVRRMRLQTKSHASQPRGRIARMVPWENCGYISGEDGREFYFHRNSLLRGDFDHLTIGDEVYFTPEQGEKGPMATSVRPTGAHPPQPTTQTQEKS